MNIYKLSHDYNSGYYTYDSLIVAALNEDEARMITPGEGFGDYMIEWCSSPDQVTVELIGTAIDSIETGIILTSFNAG